MDRTEAFPAKSIRVSASAAVVLIRNLAGTPRPPYTRSSEPTRVACSAVHAACTPTGFRNLWVINHPKGDLRCCRCMADCNDCTIADGDDVGHCQRRGRYFNCLPLRGSGGTTQPAPAAPGALPDTATFVGDPDSVGNRGISFADAEAECGTCDSFRALCKRSGSDLRALNRALLPRYMCVHSQTERRGAICTCMCIRSRHE